MAEDAKVEGEPAPVETKHDHMAEPGGYSPFGGAQSFAQWDEMRRGFAADGAIRELTSTFKYLVNNILDDEEMDVSAKPDRIINLTRELRTRIPQAVEDAIAMVKEEDDQESIKAKLKAWFLGKKADSEPEPYGVFRAFKEADGSYAWLAVYSNGFKDRDGEIIPAEAHKEFEEWCDKTGNYPELRWWHLPGTRMGQAELIATTDEGFILAAGRFEEDRKEQAERLADMGNLGVSHGFTYDDRQNGVYTRYRSFEISALPWHKAANPFTGMAGLEVPMINDATKRASVVKLFGEEFTANLEQTLSNASKRAKEAGISFKEVMDAVIEGAEAAPAAAPAPDPAPAPAAVAAAPDPAPDATLDAIKTLAASVEKMSADMGQLIENQRNHEERLKSFEGNAPRTQVPNGYVPTDRAPEAKGELVAAAAAAGEKDQSGAPAHLRSYLSDLGLS